MVGNEKGHGHQCQHVPGIRCFAPCAGLRSQGIGVLECRYIALEGQSLSAHGRTKDQAAAETIAQAGLHVALRGCSVPVGSAAYASPSPLLPDWLVHRIEAQCDNWPEVVDDRPTVRRDAEEGT